MHEIRAVDKRILRQLKQTQGIVHSVFDSTLNIKLGDTLITLAHHVGEGKHNILTGEALRFRGKPVAPGDSVTASKDLLMVGDLAFSLTNTHVKTYEPFEKVYGLKAAHGALCETLKARLKGSPQPSIYDDDAEAMLGERFLKRIKRYLDKPENIEEILGLGIGLTPLGDDFLLGFMLAGQSLGKTVVENETLDRLSTRTNLISFQSLKDVANKDYTQRLKQFLEDFFENESLEGAEWFMKYGASSGLGILAGFIEAINTWRDIS